MTTALTFTDKDLLGSPLAGTDGAVCYTTSTTRGFRGRKTTTITSPGLVGLIDWREKTFTIGGVQRKWDEMKKRSTGIFSSEREWSWGHSAYKLKYHHGDKELLATPPSGPAGAVRFTPYHSHLFHSNEPAAISFPAHLHDEEERMFVLMAILQTEIHRQDTELQRKAGELTTELAVDMASNAAS
ncbi:hypothetical protein FB451DRAFT_1412707 [Mycena latifolia]|nr:hypothetical protein FB451DRAFT_1412707 [Mycena latifolia]